MADITAQTRYLEILKDRAGKGHSIQQVLASSGTGSARISYTSLHTSSSVSLPAVLEQAKTDAVEDLGVAWSVDHDFFLQHASNPEGADLWDSVMGQHERESIGADWELWHEDRLRSLSRCVSRYHIQGILPHLVREGRQRRSTLWPRLYQFTPRYSWQCNTKMSYCRVSETLYLFLVDSPLNMDQSHWCQTLKPSQLSLWVPHARNRGGLPLPQLYERSQFPLFDSLQGFLVFLRHIDTILFSCDDESIAAHPVLLSFYLSASLWRTNLQYLNQEVKQIAFKHIRRPDVKILDRLHDLRHHLSTLREEVQRSQRYIAPHLTGIEQYGPNESFQEVLDESARLERFVMDTFQLLMSSISVLDSQTSMQHAKRTSHLTLLATIYVPLAFTTGIFGMNVKEFNGSVLPIWVFVVALGVIGVATLVLLWTVRWFQDYITAKTVKKIKEEQSGVRKSEVA